MQHQIPLLSTMHRAPVRASATVLRQIETEAQAIDVSIKACGFKALYVAKSLGKSAAWISQLRTGKYPIPVTEPRRSRFVADFCRITGTTLLADFLDLQAAMDEVHHTRTQAQVNERLAAQLRAA